MLNRFHCIVILLFMWTEYYILQVGQTVLFKAAERGHAETVKMLVDYDAAVDIRDKVANCFITCMRIRYWWLQGIPYSMVVWRCATLLGCEHAISTTISLPHSDIKTTNTT